MTPEETEAEAQALALKIRAGVRALMAEKDDPLTVLLGQAMLKGYLLRNEEAITEDIKIAKEHTLPLVMSLVGALKGTQAMVAGCEHCKGLVDEIEATLVASLPEVSPERQAVIEEFIRTGKVPK